MSANTNLGNTPVNQGYVQLIHTGETGGIDGTLRTLYDGDGTASDLQIASNKVKVSTTLYIGSDTLQEYIQDTVGAMLVTNASHTNLSAAYDDAGDGAIDLTASGDVTLTNTVTLSNKTLTAPTLTGTTQGASITLSGDLTVNGTTTTVNQTNLDVSDNIIGLNRGSGSNANDSGLIIERGSTGDNAAIIWDESADKFTLGTTTSTPSATGDLTISTGTLVATIEGNVTGNVTGNADTATKIASITNSDIVQLTSSQTLSNKTLTSPIIDSVTISTIQTGSESFADNDTSLMTSAAIQDKITSYGYVTSSGISHDGSTANGVLTYKDADEATVESGLTYDGDMLTVSGSGGSDGAAGSPTLRINNTVQSSDWDTGDVVGTLEFYSADASGNAPYVTSYIKSVNETGNGTLPGGALTFGVADYNASGGAAEAMRITEDSNVGIGTTSPTQDLHLHRSGTGDDVYIQFTNGDTGTTSGDGFQIGLAGNEDARIKQIENAPMEFWTNNTERMSISAAGDVTITGGSLTLPVAEKLFFGGGTHTYIGEDVDDRLRFFCGGDEFLRFTQQDAAGELFSIYQHVYMGDDLKIRLGSSQDLQLHHDATNSYIQNSTGNLYIQSNDADKDLVLQCDDGSGGTTAYLTLDGSATKTTLQKDLRADDDVKIQVGSSGDFYMVHDSGTGQGQLINGTDHLVIVNNADDHDIILKSDNGSGGTAVYMTLDGSTTDLLLTPPGNVGIGTTSPGAKLDVKSQINVTNSNSNSLVGLKGTRFGYSTTYRVVQVGNTSGNESVSIGYDPSGNSSGSFTGDGREVLFRNGAEFMTPNSDDDGFHNDVLVLKDGKVGIGTSSPSQPLHTHGTAGDTRTRISTSNHGTYFESGVTADSAGILLVAGHNSSILNIYLQNSGGSASNEFQFQHDGDFHADGDVVAYSTTVSDERLKDNVKTIPNALDKVMKLRGVEFDWNQGKRKGTHDLGLIAQEVEEVLPELVRDKTLCTGEHSEGNEKEFKTVDYDKIVGVLIEAIKEQQEEIECLKANYDQLKYNRR